MRALDLLKLFLTHPRSLAIVVDEFGGTEGIITMSDIVEEILGDAAPSRGDVDLYIEPLEDGKFLVSGHARLDDLREHLGFELEADGIDTIGALFSTDSAICRRLAQKSNCRGSRLLLDTRVENESKNCFWKRPPVWKIKRTLTPPPHERSFYHRRLLGDFVSFQRNRSGTDIDRS